MLLLNPFRRPFSSIPTPPLSSRPPKIFDFEPPIDFPEPEPFGHSEAFTERPTPFPALRSRPALSASFSDIPKFDLGRDFDFDEQFDSGNGPRPFSMAEIRKAIQSDIC